MDLKLKIVVLLWLLLENPFQSFSIILYALDLYMHVFNKVALYVVLLFSLVHTSTTTFSDFEL